jgi:hypothetical protein
LGSRRRRKGLLGARLWLIIRSPVAYHAILASILAPRVYEVGRPFGSI